MLTLQDDWDVAASARDVKNHDRLLWVTPSLVTLKLRIVGTEGLGVEFADVGVW